MMRHRQIMPGGKYLQIQLEIISWDLHTILILLILALNRYYRLFISGFADII